MRLADHPWGPWSAPQTIFNPMRDAGYCHFIHRAVAPGNPACDNVSAPNRLGVPGADYGPYFISRFTTRASDLPLSVAQAGDRESEPCLVRGHVVAVTTGDEARGSATFYYTMYTWNPYTQVIMKAAIQTSP